MPFVVSRASVPVRREQETALRVRMGQAISLIPPENVYINLNDIIICAMPRLSGGTNNEDDI